MGKIYAILARYFKKHRLIILVFIYLTTRLIKINILPIFNDEAIWIDWGYRAVNLKGFLFYSLLDAKPPLLMWIFGLAQKVISDPLTSGRVVSVIFGLLTLIGVYKISQKLFTNNFAVISSILYIVNPLFLFFDRQALMESAISSVGVWSFYFLNRLLKTRSKKSAFLLGLILALGYFIKSNALIFLLVALVLVAYQVVRSGRKKALKQIDNLLITLGVFLLTVFPLIMQQGFWTSLPQNSKYALTFPEIIRFPINSWLINTLYFFEILLVYSNPLIFISFFISIYLLLKSKEKTKILFYYFLGCVLIVIFIARLINVRYLVSFLPLSTILTALFLENLYLKFKAWGVIMIVLSILPSLIISYLLIADPLTYFNILNKFTNHSQKNGYVANWTSGYGFEEVREFLEKTAKDKKIIVGVRADAGIPENAVFAFFLKSQNIIPSVFDSQTLPKEIFEYDCLAIDLPFYFVSRDGHLTNLNKFFDEVKRFYKPEGERFIGIHKLKENCQGKIFEIK